MATIAESNDVHTIIVVFTVDPENQHALVEHLRDVAADHSKQDGFLCCAIHRSEDGTRVAEYIQWRSRRHWQAMIDTPAGSAHVNSPSFVTDAHIYEVASVTEA
ncbi:antibiotic biosynthesis monooxygenase family protein [Nonomuraea lactucae]|uniref:antibiotic biosynthesis monooxygenase family protein n=1 Tax=Nonomuraea lactucae TaxID=2249762 RepID=UPI000DE3F497|nr:antibiotic biosynthesis monooxygenase family protein [Nonomuraea lactucae]